MNCSPGTIERMFPHAVASVRRTGERIIVSVEGDYTLLAHIPGGYVAFEPLAELSRTEIDAALARVRARV